LEHPCSLRIEIDMNFRLARFFHVVGKKEKPNQMISLKDFRHSSFEKKCDLVTCHSNYLTMRKLADCKVYLYHTGEFFIEVYYSSVYQKVLMIHAFNDAPGLHPYVEDVSLADLNL
jgi:hypothetical protein